MFTALSKRKKPLTEEDVSLIIKQILLGVNFLHSNDVYHVSLKPENILVVDEDPNEDIKIRICDFDGPLRKPS